jgi:Methyltransferase domain
VGRVEQALDGRLLDVLFIDGDHTYAAVRDDFAAYPRFVRDGGIIAFHDIVQDYRSRFGADNGPWGGDVPRFWSEVKRGYRSLELVEDRDQNAYGIGLIYLSREEEGRGLGGVVVPLLLVWVIVAAFQQGKKAQYAQRRPAFPALTIPAWPGCSQGKSSRLRTVGTSKTTCQGVPR